jgi:tetratricopeptide (TPR) repeat protein
LLVGALLLAGCAGDPKPPPEPPVRQQAIDAETSGVLRYVRGDYGTAIRLFSEAVRLQKSLDDGAAAARNQLNRARAELALGQAQEALSHASEVSDGPLLVPALLLQLQANLALGRFDPASELLVRLEKLCKYDCPERGSFLLLRARVALTDGNAKQALVDAESALSILKEQQEERETANALRAIAAARLALGELPAALVAAQKALEIDRQLALPEKIARDWMMVGDVHRRAGRANDAKSAYQRAQSVAQAAGLEDIVRLASEAIMGKTQ